MGEEQQFCLRWNNFQANITSQFETLRDEEDFVDVTLACEGQRIKAHKVVLSACSPYFKELFRSNPCKHPILFMRDVEFRHLQSLIEFMYAGEVNVAQAHLSSFLRTAESLQIRGLTEAPQRHKQDSKSQPDNSPSSNSLIQQLINPRTQSTSPKATSPNNTSSQEDEDDNDDDMLSINSSLSPPPAKRAREEEETTSHPSSSVSQTPETVQQEVESTYKSNSPELFEPKLEVPDYGSDEESKGNFLGLDNAMLDNTFSALQGGLEMLAGPSAQGYTGDPAHDAALAHHQKLHSLDPRPCPICNRMYSNLSNLRQHVRLIHNPQTVACPLCSKPFKTKLYLKRHLMSFHELLWTSTGGKPTAATSAAAPTPPQGGTPHYAGPPTQAEHVTPQPAEDKSNYPNASPPKNKDPGSNPSEYFQTTRMYHNPCHNGERTYTPHAGQEISMFPVTQVPKEDGSNYPRTLDKAGYKPDNNSFLNNSDFHSRYVSGSIEHAGNDGMVPYVDTNNQKTSAFISSLSLIKSEAGYVGSGTTLENQEIVGRSTKPLDYLGSATHLGDQMELNSNNCKQPSHVE